MSSKGVSTEKELKQVESSSEEHIDSSYDSTNIPQIFLDIEEKPELIIEKILINIFNKYIAPVNVDMDYSEIETHKKKIQLLCRQQEKSKIVYILLIKIRSLIKKYREKLFELPNIIELREKIFQKYYKRSHSFNKIISDNYINFALDRPSINHSFSKTKKMIFNYYLTVKNLFCELKNIKNCLRRTAPIIEKIFELPLSKYEKFSIWECEKEDYLKILIHDNFIRNQISKSKNSYLNEIISEITEEDDMNLTEMTDRIDYFNLIEEYKKKNIDDMLKLSKVGSSMDTRFPEDAKPLNNYKEESYEKNKRIIAEDRDSKFSFEEADIDDFPNSEDPINDDINNFKQITLIKAISKNKTREINQGILTGKTLNKLNIREDNKYIDIPNLLKTDLSNLSNKEHIEKIISLNKNSDLKKIYEKNINNISKQRKKITKKNRTKKESNESIKSNNKKIDIIPNDIDDLVKYIEKDDKNENTGKKKKKNKKKKKKNKNEIKEEKKDEIEDDENTEQKNEIDGIKEDLLKNSINRFKIHKIKFKYRPKWLNKISKNS
jgi:hypothetical protein